MSFKQHLNMTVNYEKLRRQFRQFIIAWVFVVFGLLIVDIFHCIKLESLQNFKFFAIFFPSYLLCKLGYAYTMILITLVSENIFVIFKLKSKKFSPNRFRISPETLLFMKSTYSKIWEASIEITHLPYWTLPVGLSYDIYDLIFNCHPLISK